MRKDYHIKESEWLSLSILTNNERTVSVLSVRIC